MNETVEGRLELNVEADRLKLADIFGTFDISIPETVVRTASDYVTNDWLTIWRERECRLNVGSVEEVISLQHWAEVLCSLDALKTNVSFAEQVRRLRLASPEKLATALVVVIAGRYLRAGYSANFEPYAPGGSDLLVSQGNIRFCIEVKRENWRDQCRSRNVMQRADDVLDEVAASMKETLDCSGTRIELQFSKSFSKGTIAGICKELIATYASAELQRELPLRAIPGSRMIVMPRSEPLHFQTGLMSMKLTIPPESTVRVGDHLALTASFRFGPNLSALANNVRIAFRQLERDIARDPVAEGMVVISTMWSHLFCTEVAKRFLRHAPAAVTGIVVIGPDAYVVPLRVLSEQQRECLAIATQGMWRRA